MNHQKAHKIPEPLMTDSPAIQLREHIIHYLSINQPEMPFVSGKVRAVWDVSEGTHVGDESIIVSCEDLGGHNGLPGRTLVDVKVNVRVLTNMDKDDTGVQLDNLESDTMKLLANMPDPDLKDWTVNFQGIWMVSEPANPRDNMRVQVLSTIMFLENKSI